MIGRTLYELLVKGYTEKQWGKKATEQSPELINRLPVRDTFDNRYFNDRYQGIPEEGYSRMIEKIHITNFVHLLNKQLTRPVGVSSPFNGSTAIFYPFFASAV